MKKPTIMAVDDMEDTLDIIENILKDDYDVVKLASGYEAINYLFKTSIVPTAILLDIKMPEMDGYQVMEVIKKHRVLRNIPVIMITADNNEAKALEAGAADFMHKPINPLSVRMRVSNQVIINEYTKSLEDKVKNQVESMTHIKENMLDTMASVIEYRNLESGGHVMRTKALYSELTESLLNDSIYSEELGEQNPDAMIKSVPLHDVGKIGIPDNILLKPGQLNATEFEVMKTHTTIGGNIVESIFCKDQNTDGDYYRHCHDIALYHHERYNGQGYPFGIRGQDIPLSARIMAIVDVYDALVNCRVYKKATPHREAMEVIKNQAGSYFDPVIVFSAMKLDRQFAGIEQKFRED